MSSVTTQMLLRLIHIISGAAWVGFILFVALILFPAAQGAGPAGGPMMNQIINVRKFPIVTMIVALLTVVSGLSLLWLDSGGFTSTWMQSGTGKMFSAGGGLAILAVIIGMAVNAPGGKRMGAIAGAIQKRGGPPTADESAEMQRIQTRMGKAGLVVAVLVVIATGCMAVARYVS